MGAMRNQIAACAALVVMSCQSSSDEFDLRKNPDLYRDTGYQARAAVDQAAFVSPMVDARQPVVEATGPYPVRWGSDGMWSRPPHIMIEEIVTDELITSGIFTGIVEDATAETLVVTPYLTSMRAGEEERVSGRIAIAQVGLRIVIHGPAAADGERPVLLDRTIEEVSQSSRQMMPPPPSTLVGIALRKCLQKMLGLIDQSNVTRSQVPNDPALTGR